MLFSKFHEKPILSSEILILTFVGITVVCTRFLNLPTEGSMSSAKVFRKLNGACQLIYLS